MEMAKAEIEKAEMNFYFEFELSAFTLQ